ncbi:DNA adenine methylase [Algisphaera agarilytica]|uniref:Site-specific DNA-methyltransferase (adenine-specific) n=1 Tax=Algisphaera agarilytica TaxID=1385975 RepID=A0A7X0H5Z0_9BACT|nr:Dam family site-specific DNA-(adenine-N6)-methyltransferase [Algisphaera agarilytica]MBB6429926.1 DNA adenine methylase [Algisphaera agarilytica]
MNSAVKPILKWPGGKRWFANKYLDLMQVDADRYVEPFVGSGALFFALNPEDALLSDANANLIEMYEAIQSEWKNVWTKLRAHARNHSDDYYYRVRSSKPTSKAGRAAQFIYLNRTCFNGIYRVNRKGEFNVPRGSKDTVLFDDDDFEAVAESLSSAKLFTSDFESIIDLCGQGDLIYADPPYTANHNNNGFLKYNEKLFSWSDQIRLAKCLEKAGERGALFVVSNADHFSVRELYEEIGFIETVGRSSILAADSTKRCLTTEIVVKNFSVG